jgi:phosphonate transport system substrate-binding protein
MINYRKILSVFIIPILFLFWNCNQQNNENDTKQSKINDKKIKQSKILTVGSVAFNFKNEEIITQPLADFLLKWLGEYGYTSAQVLVVKTKEELIERINNDEVDIFFGSLYPTIYYDTKSKLEPVMRIWQGGLDTYHTVFFTYKENPIKNLSEIRGKTVTMERDYSTSGYFIPSIILEDAGFNLEKVNSPNANPKTGNVGYTFSNDDENTVFWVLNNKAEIGVSDNIGFEVFCAAKCDELKIIHRSDDLPRNIVSMRSDLPDAIKDRLFTAFKEIRNTEKGRKICKVFWDCTKFDSLNFPLYEELKTKFAKFLK